MLKLNINGVIHEVEGLDVNVYGHDYTDDGKIEIAVYETYTNADGFTDTKTSSTLVHMKTDLDPDLWGEDEWYGYNADTAPGEFPSEVYRFIRPFIEEVTP